MKLPPAIFPRPDLPRPLHIGLGTLLVLLLGLADFETGAELSLSIFYLVPVLYVTLTTGRGAGVILSLLSAAVWLAVDLQSGHVHPHSLIPFWNMMVRLGFFLVIAYLVSELQRASNRRRALEKIFFHDVLNLAGSIRGFADLLLDGQFGPNREIYRLIQQASEKVLDEIEAQRILSAAEQHDLNLNETDLESLRLLELVVGLYRHHRVGREKEIRIDAGSENLLFKSDQTLLLRILGNLIKNALEATPDGSQIATGCHRLGNRINFWVHNKAPIPKERQKYIFHEPPSTNPGGRGLGTYSIRILCEYLNGEAAFTSDEIYGTTFRVSFPL